jgi:hypothetical protein
MIAPPRTTERLLAGLGAKPDFRNAVLGDLAEEFASRVDTDGIESATRWYRREAARAVPHLLGSWLRGVRLGDVGHIAGVIATAYTGMVITFGILGGAIIGVVRTLGYQGDLLPSLPILASTAFLSCMMLFGGVWGAVAGYLSAWLDSRAPLVTAATFGALILLAQFVARHVFGGPLLAPYPTWYLTGAPFLAFVGTIVGGILRVRASGPANVAT